MKILRTTILDKTWKVIDHIQWKVAFNLRFVEENYVKELLRIETTREKCPIHYKCQFYLQPQNKQKAKTLPPIQQKPSFYLSHFPASPVRFRLRMAVDSEKTGSDGKVWSFCSMPFWQTTHASSSSPSSSTSSMHSFHQQSQILQSLDRSTYQPSSTVSSMAKSLLPSRRRLRLDPPNKLYFPCMPLNCVCFFLFWYHFLFEFLLH